MVLLQAGEKLIMQDVATHEKNGKGTLILTNHRLVFEQTTGMISKKTNTTMNYSLSVIQEVRTEGILFKQVCVEYSNDGAIFCHKFKGLAHAQWVPAIKSAIQNRSA
jgi:hypothetical protein